MHIHQTGKTGEEWCLNKLQEEGYRILEKNYHSPWGEIDIIAKEGASLVFIEVKTRTKESVDHTKYSITKSKQTKITKTAMAFLVNFNDPEVQEYRFDVIILKKTGNHLDINHFKNAFPPAETGDFFA